VTTGRATTSTPTLWPPQAEKLVFLTDVPGLLADVDDESSLLSQCSTDEIRALVDSGAVSSGMLPKLEAVLSALDSGVGAAHVIDGRIAHAVLLEILTDDAGVGTVIRPSAEWPVEDPLMKPVEWGGPA
jgi:acetylglutamate kinase